MEIGIKILYRIFLYGSRNLARVRETVRFAPTTPTLKFFLIFFWLTHSCSAGKRKKLRAKKKKRISSSLTAWEANARLCIKTKSGEKDCKGKEGGAQKPLPLVCSYIASRSASTSFMRNCTAQPVGIVSGNCTASRAMTSSTVPKPMSLTSARTSPRK